MSLNGLLRIKKIQLVESIHFIYVPHKFNFFEMMKLIFARVNNSEL
jgi:hypothetical protein